MKTEESDKLMEQLETYNRLWKEQEDIWETAAKRAGLSSAAYWILYILIINEDKTVTQTDLCEKWFLPKQTINSAVKKMKEDGLLALVSEKGRGNVKYLAITEAGNAFAKKAILPLIEADVLAFSSFSEEERALLLGLMQRQVNSVKEKAKELWK